MRHVLITMSAAIICSMALAAPPAQPVVKDGACPSGYSSSGNYCTPGSRARFALAKQGTCPSGYSASGNYCVASSDQSKTTIPKSGACPSGYSASSNYCLSTR